MASKTVGEKMKAKEPVGDASAPIPDQLLEVLRSTDAEAASTVTADSLKSLSVTQLKKLSAWIDGEAKRNEEEMEKCEKARHRQLFDIGNVLHPSG